MNAESPETRHQNTLINSKELLSTDKVMTNPRSSDVHNSLSGEVYQNYAELNKLAQQARSRENVKAPEVRRFTDYVITSHVGESSKELSDQDSVKFHDFRFNS